MNDPKDLFRQAIASAGLTPPDANKHDINGLNSPAADSTAKAIAPPIAPSPDKAAILAAPQSVTPAIVIAPKHTDVPPWALGYPCWLTWTTTQLKDDGSGRYDKVPTSASGHNCNAHDPKNHRSVTQVLAAYSRTHGTPDSLLFEQAKGKIAGIALELPNAPTPFAVTDDGTPLYLIALDFDSVKGNPVNQAKLKAALALLPPHYREISPSSTGLRVLVLCRVLVAAFNQGGFEVYSRVRFMTMTLRGVGDPSEVSAEVIDQIKAIYPCEKTAASAPPPKNASSRFDAGDRCVNDDILSGINLPRSHDDLKSMLVYLPTSIAQGCTEPYWFKIVLAARDGWGNTPDVKQIVREWCFRTPAEFDEAKFDKLWNRALRAGANNAGVGTIVLEAKQRGWQPPADGHELAADDVLKAIQNRFALIVLKKVGVIDHESLATRRNDGMAAPLTVLPREDGSLLIRRLVRSEFPGDRVSKRAQEFMTSSTTTCYAGVEFNPKETTPKFLNLWIPPVIVPKHGFWSAIHEFLLAIICDGNEATYDYLIRWFAHALQRPWEKPGVMIALLGGEGVGKGTLARIVRRIWKATFLHVHQIAPIVGQFNGSLERVFMVFLDEAIFSGDRAGTEALKALITEPTVFVNEKNQPGRSMPSYHRFIAATNAEHFKHIDPDNRRDLVLRVSETRKGDTQYWTALGLAIDGAEVEAFAYDLLKLDLSGFDIRTKPNTKELTLQKLQSLPPFPRWWFDCLSKGDIEEDGKDVWPECVSTHRIRQSFRDATNGQRVYKQFTDRDVKDWTRKVCPSATDQQFQEGMHRRRGFKLPTLARAREEFERYLGGQITWN